MSFSCTQDDLNDLYDMLATCRPHNSEMDNMFIKEFLMPLGVKLDEYGNGIIKIGDLPIIWSCHTDTVHRVSGHQKIVRDDRYNLKLSSKSTSGCLGADDTAGVWLMTQMIKAKRPGIYIFHRGEEVGGLGSRWIVKNTPDIAKDIKAVIALDRKGTDSVITFQGGSRCCSEEFSDSMSALLAEATPNLKFKSDRGGSFTDSACYVDLVGECTNLSVGYYDQHSSRETVNLPHLVAMREALIKADFSKLVFHRKPGEVEHRWTNNGAGWQRDPDDYSQYEGGYYGNGGGRYNNSSKIYNQAEGFYEKQFRGGYWEGMRWVTCDRASWVIWCNKKTEQRRLETAKKNKTKNKPVTTTLTQSTAKHDELGYDEDGKLVVPVIGPVPAVPACINLGAVDCPINPVETPITQVEDAFDLELLKVIRSNSIPLTRMMKDWGFDHKDMLSMLVEYRNPSAKGVLTKATVIPGDVTPPVINGEAKELTAGK